MNYDLWNMLSSILLVNDQLGSSEDQQVAQVAPAVLRATEQAIKLCQNRFMKDWFYERLARFCYGN